MSRKPKYLKVAMLTYPTSSGYLELTTMDYYQRGCYLDFRAAGPGYALIGTRSVEGHPLGLLRKLAKDHGAEWHHPGEPVPTVAFETDEPPTASMLRLCAPADTKTTMTERIIACAKGNEFKFSMTHVDWVEGRCFWDLYVLKNPSRLVHEKGELEELCSQIRKSNTGIQDAAVIRRGAGFDRDLEGCGLLRSVQMQILRACRKESFRNRDPQLAGDTLSRVAEAMIKRKGSLVTYRTEELCFLFARTRIIRPSPRSQSLYELDVAKDGLNSAEEEKEACKEILRKLPEVERKILMLRYWGSKTLQEIAGSLSISVATAHRHHEKALEAFKEQYVSKYLR